MAESIQKRLDRVLDHVRDLSATAAKIVLSQDDLKELAGGGDADGATSRDYRDIPVERGQIGTSSYVEAKGTPSGDTNFGV